MTKHSLAILLLLPLLAACAGLPPTKGEFVPYDMVLAETAGRPVECTGYDPLSDSCEGIGRSVLSGTTVSGEGQFLLDAAAGVTVTAVVQGRLQTGQVCADPGDYSVDVSGGASPDEVEFIAGIMEGVLEGFGTVCTSYFRTAQPGVYVSETRDESGALVPEGTDVSHFFEGPKPLRAAGR